MCGQLLFHIFFPALCHRGFLREVIMFCICNISDVSRDCSWQSTTPRSHLSCAHAGIQATERTTHSLLRHLRCLAADSSWEISASPTNCEIQMVTRGRGRLFMNSSTDRQHSNTTFVKFIHNMHHPWSVCHQQRRETGSTQCRNRKVKESLEPLESNIIHYWTVNNWDVTAFPWIHSL